MGRTFFEDRHAKVDGFAQRHLTWPGALRLNGAALGRDILRAPVNVVLSAGLVLTRIAAFLCLKASLRRMAGWLAGRRIVLRTSVAGRVEALDPDRSFGGVHRHWHAFARRCSAR